MFALTQYLLHTGRRRFVWNHNWWQLFTNSKSKQTNGRLCWDMRSFSRSLLCSCSLSSVLDSGGCVIDVGKGAWGGRGRLLLLSGKVAEGGAEMQFALKATPAFHSNCWIELNLNWILTWNILRKCRILIMNLCFIITVITFPPLCQISVRLTGEEADLSLVF